MYSISRVQSFTSQAYKKQIQATDNFYASLNSSVFSKIPSYLLNYMNANGAF
jgi:hypothetical protein